MPSALALKALDIEDLSVLSACLQDALVYIRDMAYLPEDQRFVLVVNRFLWEAERPSTPSLHDCAHWRRLAGLSIENVTGVRYRGLHRDGDGLLSLLALFPEAGGLRLDFADGAAIRLETSSLLCHLKDLGEAWPTPWCPEHGAV